MIRDFKDLDSSLIESINSCVYINSKAQSNQLPSMIRGHFNDTGHPGDVIHANSDLFRWQKFHNIMISIQHGKIGNPKDPGNLSNPHILDTTSGTANASINSPYVYNLVIHKGFPPSILDLVQELVRASRLAPTCIAGIIDHFIILTSL